MPTKKLFYEDAYIQSFETNIVRQAQDEEGHDYVVLEETAFYPTAGGQPNDTGEINGQAVVDVEEVDGELRHYLNEPLDLAVTDREVSAQIDWPRRFDHMQQHTGQHILSAAFAELFEIETVSFHLGERICTIDLDTDGLTEQQAEQVEARANEIIQENRAIETRQVPEEELANYPLRKTPSVTGTVRLIIIPDFDYNGCGGTHPRSTGEVTMSKILNWERQKKRIRVQFICGDRVRHQFNEKQAVLHKLNDRLNAPDDGLVEAVERLLENEKQMEKSLQETKTALLHHEAKELAFEREEAFVGKVYEGRGMKELQQLARAAVAEASEAIVVLVAENDQQLQFVCARGQAADANMKELADVLLAEIDGKGGGNEQIAQGGGEKKVRGSELLETGRGALAK
ncbi:alanyl-tRNA editing protein [Texcoconibacillus texcoconensis]|uniref:Alanyl-tRNA synthetase n=1 Tax=Texcoconibacillus texcoconensis TaxID=1095777 RepID=A0A840QQU1_9BACI|nr:DHHA1 domain-containing protein [Texcoconibacillus texcoconensis]MBB5173816.1 alanyl-tRNA synthetase [Texcoconibacillus texcoconensis]